MRSVLWTLSLKPMVKKGLTSILLFLSEMNRTDDIHAIVVHRVPVEVFPIKVEDDANIFEGLIDGLVVDRSITLRSDQLSGEITLRKTVIGIVDGLMRLATNRLGPFFVCGFEP